METKLTCRDLMIGDLICYCKENNYVTKVESIHNTGHASVSDEYCVKCFRDRKDPLYDKNPIDYFNVEILYPIPLTAEILEKNGIKWLMSEPSGKRTYSCNEPPISCTFIPDRGWYLSAGPVGSTKLPFAGISMAYYVHEIQHALRLCGVDKEITL